MKASVQYTDFTGTTAADRSDMFIEMAGEMTRIIIQKFNIPLETEDFKYIGVSAFGTKADSMGVYFFFKNRQNGDVVKYYKDSVPVQAIFGLFKRFEFQVGERLEDIE